MEEDDFHLILASNVSREAFPDNRPNHFHTRLQHPLIFESGQEWKVALKEITFHNTLLSIVDEGIEVWESYSSQKMEDIDYFRLDMIRKMPGIDNTVVDIRTYPSKYLKMVFSNKVGVKFRIEEWPTLLEKYGRLYLRIEELEIELKEVGDLEKMYDPLLMDGRDVYLSVKKPLLLATLRPRARNYPTPETLCDEINSLLETHHCKFAIVDDGVEKRYLLQTLADNRRLILNNGMHYVMGYPTKLITKTGEMAAYKPDLRRGTIGIMVYSSLCRYSLVGDTYVPLLRFAHLPSQIESGAVVNHIFNPPIYIPIAHMGTVTTIEIDLRTDSGQEFMLSPDGKVFLTLHFHRKKGL
jgi:hypothetical protein